MNQVKNKVAFYTLGCKLNFSETSTLSRSFPGDRFEKVSANNKADIYVINTCTVTGSADKKCRQAIKKFIHRSPGAFIVVTGCYAQMQPYELSGIPGVDLVLGINEKFDIAKYLGDLRKKEKPEVHSCGLSPADSFHHSWSMGDRTRSFLKVQDGCDYACSYCTIPLARGGSKNPPVSTLVKEASDIAAGNVKEIILTGVNIGDFGKTSGESFAGLLRELVKIPGIERYRISSIEPNLLTGEIIDLTLSSEKILPHFHIPLQSGSDKILGLMRRRYKRKLFAEKVMTIRERLPLAGIGADVITGFPGETASDFDDTFSFIEKLPLSYLHVFTFSERPGTVAAGLTGKVSQEEKERRSKMLISLSGSKNREFLKKNLDHTTDVLFEHTHSKGMITGYTGNYIRVRHPWDPELAGTVKRVLLTDIPEDGIMNVKIIY